jgi:ASC-1-like (ASCH) protein
MNKLFGGVEGGRKNKPGVMYLGEIWFNEVEEGNKKIDIRPGKLDEFKDLEGKEITYYFKNKEVKVKCTKVKHYSTVAELVAAEDLMQIAPQLKNVKAVKDNIESYYTPDRIEKAGGIVAIHFK